MSRLNLKGLIGFAVVVATAAITSQAEAGFHHHTRGWGWSYGSYGSYGYGSYGSYGSSGGSWGSSGSWGSYGSWGSWGGYGSSGSSGGYIVSYGSSGRLRPAARRAVRPAVRRRLRAAVTSFPAPISPGPSTTPPTPTPTGPTPGPADAAPTAPAPAPEGSSTYMRGTSNALLSVNVPADAKVFVNGTATVSTGNSPSVHFAQPASGCSLQLRSSRRSRVATARRSPKRRAFSSAPARAGELAFEFTGDDTQQANAVRTTVMLHVPADAKVFLSGHEMTATGPVRQFSTSRLGAGQEWTNYNVRCDDRARWPVGHQGADDFAPRWRQSGRPVRLRRHRTGRGYSLVSPERFEA